MRQAEAFQYVLGYVEDIDVEGNRAYITDSFGLKHNVPIYPRRGGGPIPRVGEQWVFDRSMGELAFHSMMTSNPSSVTNLGDLVAVLEAMGFIVDELVPGGGGDHDHDTDYAAIVHTHDGGDIVSGTIAIGRLPVGTGASDVASGDHDHEANVHIVDPSEPASPPDGLLWTNPDENLDGVDHDHSLPETLYFTSSDTFDKADYPGLRAVKVKAQGAGGGGAGSGTSGDSGGGGGGGAYAEALVLVGDLVASETVTVGGGGAGGAAGNNNGSVGGASSFGSHAAANGGSGGQSPTNYHGGAGGAPTAGDLQIYGDGGGAGSANTPVGGAGGSSHLGGGANGRFGNFHADDGRLYGGGGAGAPSQGTNVIGGDGADGIVIVELIF